MQNTWKRSLVLLVVASVCLTACRVRLDRTLWVLHAYGEPGNEKPVLEGTEITAVFDAAAGQVSGSSGCNNYFGDYEASGVRLSISNLSWTEMACAEPVMSQEQQYLTALQAAESYQLRYGRLQISCSGGQVLRFAVRQ
jgi:heat shock protein HslJ